MYFKNSLNNIIIHLPQKRNDEIKVGGKTLYLDSSWNPIQNRIPYAKVVQTPSKTPTDIQVGDLVYFHHNIVENPSYSLGDDYYIIPNDPRSPMVYAYKRDDKLTPINGFMFIEPIDLEEVEKGGLVVKLNNEWPSKGKIRYASQESLDKLGCNIGSLVNFRKFRKYIIEIDGEGLLRLKDKDVNFIYDGD